MDVLGPAWSVTNLLLYTNSMFFTTGGKYLTFGFLVAVVLMTIYLHFYSEKLLQGKLAGQSSATVATNDTASVSKVNVIMLLLIGIAWVILGILEISGHPGASFGVNATTVDTISGIGNIAIGAFFAGRLSHFLSRIENAKTFEREVVSFIAVLLLWTAIISTIYVHHV